MNSGKKNHDDVAKNTMARLISIMRTLGNGFNRLEEAFLCLLLLAMILLSCTQIFLRDVLSEGFIWADPLLRYLVIWAGLLGAAVATRRQKHISIDLASHLVPESVTPWLGAIANFFSTAVCVSLTYASIVFIQNEYAFSSGREVLGIPAWGMNIVFPLAFALMTLRFLIVAIRNAASIVKQRMHS